MTLNDQIRMRKEIDRILEKAIDLYDVPDLSGTIVKFDIRSYRFVGHAGVRRRHGGDRYTLRLNPKAVVENFDDMLNDTIPHEIAHLVNYANPSTGHKHNNGWKRVCLALGGNGQRLCSKNSVYDLGQPTADERKIAHDARRPYVYTDSNGIERRLTKQRHNKLQRPLGGYALTWRDGAKVDENSPWRFDRIPTVKQVAPKTRKQQARTRKGQMTKAQIARNLIRLHFAAGPDQLNTDQIIAKIAGTCGLKLGLAKTYFNNNLSKAIQ